MKGSDDWAMSYYRKKFYRLRDQRDQILKSDLKPDERYRQSQAIQNKINHLAEKIEARVR